MIEVCRTTEMFIGTIVPLELLKVSGFAASKSLKTVLIKDVDFGDHSRWTKLKSQEREPKN